MVDGLDGKHAKLHIAHPLTVSNLNTALNDVDNSMPHLFDELDGFGKKQVIVPLLVADASPIVRLAEHHHKMIRSSLLRNSEMPSFMFFFRPLSHECRPTALLGMLA